MDIFQKKRSQEIKNEEKESPILVISNKKQLQIYTQRDRGMGEI